MTREMYFQTRFVQDAQREVLWRTLYHCYFARLIAPTDCVVELGAGYCYFINEVVAKRKIAIDSWSEFVNYLDSGIESRVSDVTNLSFLESSSVNFVFASNLFEHISQDDFASVLLQLKNILARDGTLNILQPNYYYSYREYFDDYTHRTVYTHTSISDFLRAHGYEVIDCRPRFLPLTVKSRLPVSPVLIRLYLSLPWKPFGKQMFIRARVNKAGAI